MFNAYILDGFRLPIGKANGYYKSVMPEMLLATLLRHLQGKYTFLPNQLDELLLGVALGTGGNMARYALLEAGYPLHVPAYTLDFQCGSGLKALTIAEAQLKSDISQCLIAGGMESNSLAPKRQYHPRDSRYVDADTFYTRATFAPTKIGDASLPLAAQQVADQYQISKANMMDWTVNSHKKAHDALQKGYLNDVMIPFETYIADQPIRKNLTLEHLQQSQTSQLIDHTNTAHLHDGAAVLLMANKPFCDEHSLIPQFEIVASATAGGLPNQSPLGVVWATEKLLKNTGIQIDEIGLFEVNESFAVKPLAFIKHFGVSVEKVNIFGGGLAYGHPFGASGAINTLHLMQAMKIQKVRYGLVTIGVAGGQGVAMLLENVSYTV
jgi:acetyl-CoA C-acetyltransferase